MSGSGDDEFPLLDDRATLLSFSLTCALLVMWLFLCMLSAKHLWYVYKHGELQRRLKCFAGCCIISFVAYISLTIATMAFYQRGLIVKYRYAVAISYVLNAIGKQSMYCVFLTTLYTTFKRSQYQLSKRAFQFVVVLIAINGLLGLVQSYVWIENRILGNADTAFLGLEWCHYLTLCMTPTELFYSLLIITLFARRLFRISLQRVNERKNAQYQRRVRSQTASMIHRHKVALEEFGRTRSQSQFSDELDGDGDGDAAPPQKFRFDQAAATSDIGHSTADFPPSVPTASSPSSGSAHAKVTRMPDASTLFNRSHSTPLSASRSAPSTPLASLKSTVMRGFPSAQFDSILAARSSSPRSGSQQQLQPQMKRTPSLRQRKSMNIRRFNKENRALLDHYQVKMMKTAARYTVLSSVAFITTLCCTCFVAITWLSSMRSASNSNVLQLQTVDLTMTLVFMTAANNCVNALAVIFNFAIFPKVYRYLCCCSFCCKSCFMYCALRQLMNKVEDQMTMEFQSECERQLQEMEIELDIDSPRMTDMASFSKDGADLDGVDEEDEEVVIANIEDVNFGRTHAHVHTNTVQSTISGGGMSHSMQMSDFVILDPDLQSGAAARDGGGDALPEPEEEPEEKKQLEVAPPNKRLSMIARISKKIMSITITSPDNMNTVVMAAKKRASQLAAVKELQLKNPGFVAGLHPVQSFSSQESEDEERQKQHGQQTSAASQSITSVDISAVLDKEESLSKGLDVNDEQGHARFESVEL